MSNLLFRTFDYHANASLQTPVTPDQTVLECATMNVRRRPDTSALSQLGRRSDGQLD